MSQVHWELFRHHCEHNVRMHSESMTKFVCNSSDTKTQWCGTAACRVIKLIRAILLSYCEVGKYWSNSAPFVLWTFLCHHKGSEVPPQGERLDTQTSENVSQEAQRSGQLLVCDKGHKHTALVVLCAHLCVGVPCLQGVWAHLLAVKQRCSDKDQEYLTGAGPAVRGKLILFDVQYK